MKGRICKKCNNEISRDVLDSYYSVCPICGNYMRFHARKRIASLADIDSFIEWNEKLRETNPLNDVEYEKKLVETASKHKLNEAVITGEIQIEGIKVAIGVMDTRFMMASMGQVVGEKITRLFEKATKKKLPVLLFCCSGGARMQEGIVSLMQMEKTAAAVKRHSEAGLLYISVLTNPTMGGVTASYATSADIVLAEKGAMIGFAGRRVIEQNTGEKLPNDFQTAEFQLEKGFVDDVVERATMREYLAKILRMHLKKKIKRNPHIDIKRFDYSEENEKEYSPWDRVKIARAKERPTTLDYVNRVFDNVIEFHGDRNYEDDHAIVGGIATLNGYPVTFIGQQKGKKDLNEAVYRNWGMASQSGYRKALRLMKQSEKFKRPSICFVDTVGAACGKDAEEHGQGTVIAELLRDVSAVKVPILSIIIGEGGSGGALALAVGNEVWALENSVYSILSPEGYASILWKDNSRAEEAAQLMKMTADDLYELGIVEKVISEPENLNTENMKEISIYIKNEIINFLLRYRNIRGFNVAEKRYRRFRKY